MMKLPEGLEELSGIFSANGYDLFMVGGYVRNTALGISGGDLDVCSAAPPFEAAFFLRKAGLNVIDKAPELGTIEVHIRKNGKTLAFEHTTFRRDFYPVGGEHRPKAVEFTDDMQQDAARRDFTVNALYLDLRNGRILDPTGRGLTDAKARVIRAAAADPEITIRDDGLRIMRMARFAAELGFTVSQELMDCAKKHAPLLADISAERKRDELLKIIMSDTKYPGPETKHAVLNGLMMLKESGALPYLLPRLSEGAGVAQSEEFHKYDVLDHGIHSCAAAPAVKVLRLAALLHDIGKPAALKSGGAMFGHDRLGAALAEEELKGLRLDNATVRDAVLLVRHHMFDLEGRARPSRIRRKALQVGKRLFPLLIGLRRADFIGSGMHVEPIVSADNWQKEFERMKSLCVPWSVKDLEITGDDIVALGVKPSPTVGDILDRLFGECAANPKLNERSKLIARAGKLLNLLP